MHETPTLEIDLSLATPAYRQIADGLRRLLVAGDTFQVGDRLPPVRQLALDLGVHHNTVAQSFRLLAEEGWLELIRGRGAVVRRRLTPRISEQERDAFQLRFRSLLAEALGAGVEVPWLAEELRRWALELQEPREEEV